MLLDSSYYASSDSGSTEESDVDKTEELAVETLSLPAINLTPISSELEDKYSIAPNVDNYLNSLMLPVVNNLALKQVYGALNAFFFVDMKLSTRQRAIISNVIKQYNTDLKTKGFRFQCDSLVYSELRSPLPLHVTLASYQLRKDPDFLDSVRKQLVEKSEKSYKPFKIKFEPVLKVFQNDNKAKYFLTLKVEAQCSSNYLEPLSNEVNRTIVNLVKDKKVLKNSVCQGPMNIKHMSIGVIDNQDDIDVSQLPQMAIPQHELEELVFPCNAFKMTKLRSQLSIPLGSAPNDHFRLSIF